MTPEMASDPVAARSGLRLVRGARKRRSSLNSRQHHRCSLRVARVRIRLDDAFQIEDRLLWLAGLELGLCHRQVKRPVPLRQCIAYLLHCLGIAPDICDKFLRLGGLGRFGMPANKRLAALQAAKVLLSAKILASLDDQVAGLLEPPRRVILVPP